MQDGPKEGQSLKKAIGHIFYRQLAELKDKYESALLKVKVRMVWEPKQMLYREIIVNDTVSISHVISSHKGCA